MVVKKCAGRITVYIYDHHGNCRPSQVTGSPPFRARIVPFFMQRLYGRVPVSLCVGSKARYR